MARSALDPSEYEYDYVPSIDAPLRTVQSEMVIDDRDTMVYPQGMPVGRTYLTTKLDPNEAGIYATPKPPPVGDIVLQPSERTQFTDTMPRVESDFGIREDIANYDPSGDPYTRVGYTPRALPADIAWLSTNAPFPTQQKPTAPPMRWTTSAPKVPFGQDPGDTLPGRAPPADATPLTEPPKPPRDAQHAPAAVDEGPPQLQQQLPASAANSEPTKKKPLHPIEIFEDAVKEFPIIHDQGLTAGPGGSTEYWPVGEPGTQARPRPSFIPIDQPGMEIGPDARPLDVLGDVVSHHMVNTDPVIKKTYEDFGKSLTGTQKELLQAQYMYYTKNEGETRPYDQWEKSSGLPAYFRGYAFQQWPQDFNKTAYTPQQRYRFDQMMGYLRTGRQQAPQSLQ